MNNYQIANQTAIQTVNEIYDEIFPHSGFTRQNDYTEVTRILTCDQYKEFWESELPYDSTNKILNILTIPCIEALLCTHKLHYLHIINSNLISFYLYLNILGISILTKYSAYEQSRLSIAFITYWCTDIGMIETNFLKYMLNDVIMNYTYNLYLWYIIKKQVVGSNISNYNTAYILNYIDDLIYNASLRTAWISACIRI